MCIPVHAPLLDPEPACLHYGEDFLQSELNGTHGVDTDHLIAEPGTFFPLGGVAALPVPQQRAKVDPDAAWFQHAVDGLDVRNYVWGGVDEEHGRHGVEGLLAALSRIALQKVSRYHAEPCGGGGGGGVGRCGWCW